MIAVMYIMHQTAIACRQYLSSLALYRQTFCTQWSHLDLYYNEGSDKASFLKHISVPTIHLYNIANR